MNRPIESYTEPTGEGTYDASKPSVVRGYFPRSKGQDYFDRLPEEAKTEIEELVYQSMENWPELQHDELVSDIANVDFLDTNEVVFRLQLGIDFDLIFLNRSNTLLSE